MNVVKTPAPAAVLFDLDGTLIDTAPDFHRVLNQLRQEQNLVDLDYRLVRNDVSNGAMALIQTGFQIDEHHPDFAHLHQRLLTLYEQSIAELSTLFPGADTLLCWLEAQQIPWGIVTNKPRRFTQPLIKALALEQRCAVLICPDDVQQRKPHPEALFLACSKLGVTPEQSLYVGDHHRDIEAGRRAGMHTVAATFGYIAPEDDPERWQSDTTASSCAALLDWLQQRTIPARIKTG